MAATFSAAVSVNAVAIVDTAASQATGAANEGIGLTGADEASISGWRLGAAATTSDLKIDTGDGPGY